MKIYLATDHAGFEMKEELKKYLIENQYEVDDCGAYEINPDDDYPDFIDVAAKKVAHTTDSFGVIFGASGQGEAICANKTKGVRAAVYNSDNLDVIKLAREHNDANILSVGAKFVSGEKLNEAVKLFISTNFTNETRHVRRIEKISDIENNG